MLELKYLDFSWSGFEQCLLDLQTWLKEIEANLANEPQLKSTLDEKRAQLQKYRGLLNDVNQHNQGFVKLRSMYDELPQKDDDIKDTLESVISKYDDIVKKTKVSSEFTNNELLKMKR